jgi:hypothetical protein
VKKLANVGIIAPPEHDIAKAYPIIEIQVHAMTSKDVLAQRYADGADVAVDRHVRFGAGLR